MVKILILSDLLIDFHINENLFNNGIQTEKGIPVVSGTGFNAAKSFHKHGLECMLLGYVGNDENGMHIKRKINELEIPSIINIYKNKETSIFHIILSRRYSNSIRLSIDETKGSVNITNNDIKNLLSNSLINKGDYIFITAHFFYRKSLQEAKKMIETIVSFGLLIIVDLTPHIIYKKISFSDFSYVFGANIHILVSELYTISRVFDISCNEESPNQKDINKILKYSKSDILILNYGKENNESRQILQIHNGSIKIISNIRETGFTNLSIEEKFSWGEDILSNFMLKLIKSINSKNKKQGTIL
ncbi:MAG TPA: hypothetical protein EYG89_01110 [Bacteroidia bacterium]|nr:hypothetical protein [Bacteroidia bacterium]